MGFGKKLYLVITILVIIVCSVAIAFTKSTDLSKVKDDLVELETAEYKPENDGKLVLVKGKLDVKEGAIDPKFEITTDNAVMITREVLQCRYVIDRTYSKHKANIEWAVYDERDSPSSFKLNDEGKTYNNPIRPRVKSESFYPKEVYIGDFAFSGDVLEIVGSSPLQLSQELVDDINARKGTKYILNTSSTGLTDMRTGNHLGDHKITFYASTTEDFDDVVTIVGRQNGNKIEKYELSEIKGFFKFYPNDITAEEIWSEISVGQENDILAYYGFIGIALIIGLFVFKGDLSDLKNKIFKKNAKNA